MPDVATEPRSLLDKEHHQLLEPVGLTTRIFGVRDGLLGFGDRGVLVLKYVGPQPASDGDLVGLEVVITQPQESV
jgi:hypothetical protein